MPPSVPRPARDLIISLALELSVSHHFHWGLRCFLLVKKGFAEPCLREWVCVLSLHNPRVPAAGELETWPGVVGGARQDAQLQTAESSPAGLRRKKKKSLVRASKSLGEQSFRSGSQSHRSQPPAQGEGTPARPGSFLGCGLSIPQSLPAECTLPRPGL